MKYGAAFATMALALSAPGVQAQEHRELDAHEHGVGMLTLALDGNALVMELEAPGADIVGFEHVATSDADKAAIAAALKTLEQPQMLFTMPEGAGCSITEAHAELHGGEDDHDEHDDHDHDHEDHAAHDDHDDHDDHGHEAEHEEAHAEHDTHDHDAHDHGEDHAHEHGDAHDDHDEAATHSEFVATYSFTCAAPDALTTMAFPYFQEFPNARELEVQAALPGGVFAAEVERDEPELDLKALQ